MRKLISLIAWLALWSAIVSAQVTTRDYSISDVQFQNAPDGRITVIVTIINRGAGGTNQSTVRVFDLSDETIIAQGDLIPLGAGQSVALQFPLNPADFAPRTRLDLRVEAGIDDFELKGSPRAIDNIQEIVLPLVLGFQAPATPATISPQATPVAVGLPQDPIIVINDSTVNFNLFGNRYEFTRDEVLIALGIAIGAFIIFWLFTVILRQLTKKSATFPLWQAPYASVPALDPNSVDGRRQAWQVHAQNGLILAANRESALHPIKQLVGTDNLNLSNWQITALRLSLYDNYGRVARTQVIAKPSMINQLNRIIKRRAKVDDNALARMVAGITRPLVLQFKRNLSSKNAFLPVALDLRFSGKHGEVRILFELYQYQQGAWYRIDQWEPSMAISSRTLQENYTYTIHGMGNAETLKAYVPRLQDDLAWLLVETFRLRQAQQNEARPDYNVPDTLSGMKPVL
jgi:hypothetical protein